MGGRRRLLATLTAVALIASAVAATAPSASAAPHPLVTGVSYIPDYENDPVTFGNVRRAGARMALVTARWGTVAPRRQPASWRPWDPADPHYDWATLDAWVVNATAAGLTPVVQIRGAPFWAQRCPAPTHRDSPCRPDPAGLAAFATAAATRYSGRFGGLPRVRYWQGLNEPNLSLFFQPQFEGSRPASPHLYRELINVFYDAVKAVDPSNLVLAAGLGPIGIPGYTIGPLRFARLLLCMKGRRNPRPLKGNCGGGVRFDIFDMHPYTTGGPTHRSRRADDVQLGDLAKLKTLLRAADRAGRIKGRFKRTPLWITEFSWDSKPPDPGGVPMRLLGRWTAQALHQAWRAGVSRFFWFTLRDPDPTPSLSTSEAVESGLFFRGARPAEDRPKRALYAFRFPFVAEPRKAGFTFWGRTPNGRGGKVRIQVRDGKRWRAVATVRAARNGIFNGFALGAGGPRKRGTARARYRAETALPFSLRPVRDFHQPPFGRPQG